MFVALRSVKFEIFSLALCWAAPDKSCVSVLLSVLGCRFFEWLPEKCSVASAGRNFLPKQVVEVVRVEVEEQVEERGSSLE